MSKRECPFSNSPMQMKTHVGKKEIEDKQEVYERTLELLKTGAAEYSQREAEIASDIAECCVCNQTCNNLIGDCHFCEKKACEYCFRQCLVCKKDFCSLCSLINYDMKHERVFCLSCKMPDSKDTKHRHIQKNNVVNVIVH